MSWISLRFKLYPCLISRATIKRDDTASNCVALEIANRLQYAMVKVHTVWSRIVAPSLIVHTPYFFNQEDCYDMLKISIFWFKTTYFINGAQHMQLYNVICCFLWYLPHFIQFMNLNLTF